MHLRKEKVNSPASQRWKAQCVTMAPKHSLGFAFVTHVWNSLKLILWAERNLQGFLFKHSGFDGQLLKDVLRLLSHGLQTAGKCHKTSVIEFHMHTLEVIFNNGSCYSE